MRMMRAYFSLITSTVPLALVMPCSGAAAAHDVVLQQSLNKHGAADADDARLVPSVAS